LEPARTSEKEAEMKIRLGQRVDLEGLRWSLWEGYDWSLWGSLGRSLWGSLWRSLRVHLERRLE
jgi:hypothetical protein